jgi:uncharacterized membrane protein
MRLAALGLIAPLALAACDEPAAPAAGPAPAAPAAPAVLGDVDLAEPLRVLGTEPFWGVDITDGGLVYSGVDRPERRAPNPGAVVQGTTAVYTTAFEDGAPLVVTLIDTDCSDGMSDRIYPLTARVEVGTEALNGCAAPTAVIMTTDEQGRPKAEATAAATGDPAEG